MQQEILRLLFIKSGKSLNQLQIARFLKVSQPAIMKSLPKLGQEEYIKSVATDKFRISAKENEYIVDPACGSGGFLLHTMYYVWDHFLKSPNAQKKYANFPLHSLYASGGNEENTE